MDTFKSFESLLYTINDQSFEEIALSLFRFQANNNPIYKQFIHHLNLDIENVKSINSVPFLPISFFKNHPIKTGKWDIETTFVSSGTSGGSNSQHHIKDLEFYLSHAERCFNTFFGQISDYHFLAFLPSYHERKDSSLIAMMNRFIQKSNSPFSGFYLNDIDQLLMDLQKLKNDSRKTILWGVSFALLDLAEKHHPDLSHCMLFETGGMKGRRKEITKEELHNALKAGFNVDTIYSEYGMTELLSQAYSWSTEFVCPPWMKVMNRELSDPMQKGAFGETGGLNVIDLANWHSVAFIETEDLAKVYDNGNFEILGRIDNSDIRGCNLMVE